MVMSCDDMKCVTRRQPKGDILAGDFDVGFVKSTRSQADLRDLGQAFQQGKNPLKDNAVHSV